MGIFRVETSGSNITPTSQVAEKMNRERSKRILFSAMIMILILTAKYDFQPVMSFGKN